MHISWYIMSDTHGIRVMYCTILRVFWRSLRCGEAASETHEHPSVVEPVRSDWVTLSINHAMPNRADSTRKQWVIIQLWKNSEAVINRFLCKFCLISMLQKCKPDLNGFSEICRHSVIRTQNPCGLTAVWFAMCQLISWRCVIEPNPGT